VQEACVNGVSTRKVGTAGRSARPGRDLEGPGLAALPWSRRARRGVAEL